MTLARELHEWRTWAWTLVLLFFDLFVWSVLLVIVKAIAFVFAEDRDP